MWPTHTHDLSVTAVVILGGVIDDAGCDRVEVDVGNDLSEVLVGVDHSRPVTALPEPAEITMAPVVVPGHAALQPGH